MFNIIVLPNIAPQYSQTRRSHRKSRHGCTSCKERRMKCDEVRPICGNCSRKFVNPQPCDYRTRLQREMPALRPLVPRLGESHSQFSRENPMSSSRNSEITVGRSIDAGALDPFQSYPVSQVPGLDDLMKDYLALAVYRSFPWQPASTTNPTSLYYVPLVLNDIVLFHITLLLATLRLKERTIRKPNLLHLRSECVRLLRDRIENTHHNALSDETLAAVATMAAIEHERGNIRMLKMHMEGLKTMIDLRGGLQPVRQSSPMVANFIIWMFVVSSYENDFPVLDPILPIFNNEPKRAVTHPEDIACIPSRSISHFEDIAPIHAEPPEPNLSVTGLQEPITSILRSVQHASQVVPSSAAYPTASTSLVILTRMCSLLSHLLSLPPQPSLISEATRFATLLHVFTPWRGLPPDGSLAINRLLHSLISTLRALVATNPAESSLVLWIFAVGGVAADGLPERHWFVSHLVLITENMGIETWEQMKSLIRVIIWHEILCNRPHHILWREVEERRKDLQDVESSSSERDLV